MLKTVVVRGLIIVSLLATGHAAAFGVDGGFVQNGSGQVQQYQAQEQGPDQPEIVKSDNGENNVKPDTAEEKSDKKKCCKKEHEENEDDE